MYQKYTQIKICRERNTSMEALILSTYGEFNFALIHILLISDGVWVFLNRRMFQKKLLLNMLEPLDKYTYSTLKLWSDFSFIHDVVWS